MILEYVKNCGPVFGPVLVSMWIFAFGLAFHRVTHLRKRRIRGGAALEPLWSAVSLLASGRPRAVFEAQDCLKRKGTHPLGEALFRILHLSSSDRALRFRLFAEETLARIRRADHRTDLWLAVLLWGAPLVGLLGTVVGMTGTLKAMGSETAASIAHSISQVTGPASLSTSTTVLGLLIALSSGIIRLLFPIGPIDAEEDHYRDLVASELEAQARREEAGASLKVLHSLLADVAKLPILADSPRSAATELSTVHGTLSRQFEAVSGSLNSILHALTGMERSIQQLRSMGTVGLKIAETRLGVNIPWRRSMHDPQDGGGNGSPDPRGLVSMEKR